MAVASWWALRASSWAGPAQLDGREAVQTRHGGLAFGAVVQREQSWYAGQRGVE